MHRLLPLLSSIALLVNLCAGGLAPGNIAVIRSVLDEITGAGNRAAFFPFTVSSTL